MEEQKGKPVNINLVLNEYKVRVSDLTHENLLLQAYVGQLEKQLNELSGNNNEQSQSEE